MTPFKLIPSISPSEKEFVDIISKEKWEEIKTNVYNKSQNCCYGCGHTPADIKMLTVHLHWWDEKDLKTAQFLLLCEGCHHIKHFDSAIENNFVVLVNSTYSQEELLRMNRIAGQIKENIENMKIVLLKKTAEEYFNEIKESELNRNSKTKILFGNKFNWKK